MVGQPHPVDGVGGGVGRNAVQVGEIPHVVDDAQVVVDGRFLRDVADAATQRGDPAGWPRTVTVPDATIWVPTIERMSVVLPQPDGPRRPVTVPRAISTEKSCRATRLPRTTRR